MNFFPILKKELRSYFSSLIAYIVLTVFLGLSGYFFYTNMILFVTWGGSSIQEGLWQYHFHDMRKFLLFTFPLLTMRLFAEEKKLTKFSDLLNSGSNQKEGFRLTWILD